MFDNKEVAAQLAHIHDKYVVVPADNASNNLALSAKYYIQCFIKEHGMGSNREQNKTPISPNINFYHKSVLSSSSDKDNDIPLLYWIPKSYI